jgi:hypothetical protein
MYPNKNETVLLIPEDYPLPLEGMGEVECAKVIGNIGISDILKIKEFQ